VNRSRVDTVIDSIVAERLDMTTWARRTSCGTVMCLAGWAAVHAGDPPRFLEGATHTMYTLSGYPVETVAREYLGLTVQEACTLFLAFHAKTPDDLRDLVDQLEFEELGAAQAHSQREYELA
jgi:hypothetical protein